MAERRKAKSTPAKKASAKKPPTGGVSPSSADLDSLERFEPSDKAKAHEPSDVDAMGQKKRREVVGHSYGPSRRSQLTFFFIVGALVLLVVGGSIAAVSAFDQPEDEYPAMAPWSEAGGADNPSPGKPSSPCGEPGNPPQFEAGTPCTAERTSDQGPDLPGAVPPGAVDADTTDPKSGSGSSAQ